MLHGFKSVALKLAPVSLISQTWQHPFDQMCAKHYLECTPLLAATPWGHLPGKARSMH